jgi:hypothetical protein
MTFAPQIEGTVSIHSSAAQFAQAFTEQVAAGLLNGQPHPRSNYQVVDATPGQISVRAADWWTAANVGLNELELRLQQPGSVQYRVRYWRWACFALGLSGLLGIIGLVLLLAFDARGYMVRHEASMPPGLSVDQNLVIAWAMTVFWGFAWPWLLIALHKRPLHQLVARLIREVDARATPAEAFVRTVLR